MLRGSAPLFFIFFIFHLREKRVKQKLIRMCSPPKFVSRLFLRNKENELHRKYALFGGPAGSLSRPTILQIKQI